MLGRRIAAYMLTQIGTNMFQFLTQIGTNMFYVSPAVQRDQSQRRRCSITSLGICILDDLFVSVKATGALSAGQ